MEELRRSRDPEESGDAASPVSKRQRQNNDSWTLPAELLGESEKITSTGSTEIQRAFDFAELMVDPSDDESSVVPDAETNEVQEEENGLYREKTVRQKLDFADALEYADLEDPATMTILTEKFFQKKDLLRFYCRRPSIGPMGCYTDATLEMESCFGDKEDESSLTKIRNLFKSDIVGTELDIVANEDTSMKVVAENSSAKVTDGGKHDPEGEKHDLEGEKHDPEGEKKHTLSGGTMSSAAGKTSKTSSELSFLGSAEELREKIDNLFNAPETLFSDECVLAQLNRQTFGCSVLDEHGILSTGVNKGGDPACESDDNVNHKEDDPWSTHRELLSTAIAQFLQQTWLLKQPGTKLLAVWCFCENEVICDREEEKTGGREEVSDDEGYAAVRVTSSQKLVRRLYLLRVDGSISRREITAAMAVSVSAASTEHYRTTTDGDLLD